MMPKQSTTFETIAKVLLINANDEVLVLTLGKHLKHPERSFSPDLPGGIAEPGESEQNAVIREVQEECGIGLDGSMMQLAYTKTEYYEKENKSITKLLYIAHLDNAPTITLSWEHSSYKWVPSSELQAIDLRSFFNEAIQYLIANEII